MGEKFVEIDKKKDQGVGGVGNDGFCMRDEIER